MNQDKQTTWKNLRQHFPDLSPEQILLQIVEKKRPHLTEREFKNIRAVIDQLGGDLGNAVSQSIILLAQSTNSYALIKLLLANGGSPNATDSLGFTALHYAALTNQKTGCRLLVEAGSNINVQAKSGLTSLHLAAMGSNQEGKIQEAYRYLFNQPHISSRYSG